MLRSEITMVLCVSRCNTEHASKNETLNATYTLLIEGLKPLGRMAERTEGVRTNEMRDGTCDVAPPTAWLMVMPQPERFLCAPSAPAKRRGVRPACRRA